MTILTFASGSLPLSLRKGETLVIRNYSGTETVTGSTADREDASSKLGENTFIYGPQRSAATLTLSTTGICDHQIVSGDPVPFDANSVIFSEPGRKFAVVAGVIRNMDDGQGWRLITDAPQHAACNITSVSNSTSTVTVGYAGLDVKNVVSFIASPDDTLAKAGFFCGSSVGVNAAQISLKRLKTVADYVSYNGSAWVSTNGVFTPSFSAGTLTLTHEAVLTTSAGIVCSVTGRDGVYVPVAGTATGTATQVKFYDWAGTLQTTENANMKCYVNRGQYSASEDPTNVNNTTFVGSNVWVHGVFELN